MRVANVLVTALGAGLLFSSPALAQQLTYGKAPNLPEPFATKSAPNPPKVVKAPAGFMPAVPTGFHISVYADGFDEPRYLKVAPNGDVFLADSNGGKIYILRDPKNTGTPEKEIFAAKLNRPFGIAFHEGYVYVGDEDIRLAQGLDTPVPADGQISVIPAVAGG